MRQGFSSASSRTRAGALRRRRVVATSAAGRRQHAPADAGPAPSAPRSTGQATVTLHRRRDHRLPVQACGRARDLVSLRQWTARIPFHRGARPRRRSVHRGPPRRIDVLTDPGTYCYSSDALFRRYFRSTIGHNTLEVAGRDQSASGGPTMWIRHAESRLTSLESSPDGDDGSWVAEHYGYRTLAPPGDTPSDGGIPRTAAPH